MVGYKKAGIQHLVHNLKNMYIHIFTYLFIYSTYIYLHTYIYIYTANPHESTVLEANPNLRDHQRC